MSYRLSIRDSARDLFRARAMACAAVLALGAVSAASAQVNGEVGAHDPSTVIKDGSRYYYFATGDGIASRSSSDLINWTAGPSVFSTPPAWTTSTISGFTGVFWAPDIQYWDGLYRLYYSVSTWGSIRSAIGVATSPTLNPSAANYGWTDRGMVIQSMPGSAANAIDPALLQGPDGRIWMTYGSFNNGIYTVEIDRTTSKPLAGAAHVNTARMATVEGASMTYRDGYYYLFTSAGGCCSGVYSGYNTYVGRSTSPTGPFVDKAGVNMTSGGGTIFLDDAGRYVGPGHFSRTTDGPNDYYSYHYYNAEVVGSPTFNLERLNWTSDGWPTQAAVSPDFGGASGGSWAQAANWYNGTVPDGVGHVANFGSRPLNSSVVSLDATTRTLGTLNFHAAGPNIVIADGGGTLVMDAATGEEASINALGGAQTISAPVTAADRLAINVFGATGNIARLSLRSVTAPGLTKYGLGTLAITGVANFSQPVFVKWGTLEITGNVTASQYTSVGATLSEVGALTVRGTGSFTTSADLNIGDTGNANDTATGTLFIQDSASITVGSSGGFYVGSGFFANTRAAGTVHQTGGSLTISGSFDNAFTIGGRSSNLATGTYNLSNGSINANTNLRIGGMGTGTLNQTGGSIVASGHVYIGSATGSTGTLNISAGLLNQTSSGRLIYVGNAGAGTLTISGSAQVSTRGIRLGSTMTGVGTLNLNGGTLTTPAVVRGSGTGTVNFNGGVLRASSDSVAFLSSLSHAWVKAGGAVIDSQGFSIAFGQPLLHDSLLGSALDGGLTKRGSGSLLLTGIQTYTGPTVVSAGMLRLAAPLVSTSAVSIAPGAAIQLVSGSSAVLRTSALVLPTGALLDLTDRDLILDYTAVSPMAELIAALLDGRLRVTQEIGGLPTTLAIAEASDLGLARFAGQEIDETTVVAGFTYVGDANLDGLVDALDYERIDLAIGNTAAPGEALGVASGDLTYDGSVDALDYEAVDLNIGNGVGAPLVGSGPASAAIAVPEPASALLAFVTLSLQRAGRARRRE